MADDLKKQASELYREQSEAERIPTSDSLSMKRVFYITIAIAAAVLLGIQLFGGFRRRPDPVVAANTPPPLVKEAPPPGMLEAPAPPAAQGQAAPPAVTPQPQEAAKPVPAPIPRPAPRFEESRRVPSPPPAATAPGEPRKPVLTRDTEPRPSRRRGAALAQAEVPAAPAAPPKLSDIEIARRELAREIVLEKNPALAKLVTAPNSNLWSAQPEGTDEYLVSFSIVDEGAGAPVQYVWRVNVTTRSTTPLSYYARRLS